jgi:hypothetical protein
MRPRGEIRTALVSAAEQLGDQCFTWRDLAVTAQVGFAVAKQYAVDMRRAGELEPSGTRKVPHARRPMVTYRRRSGFVNAPLATLDGVLRAWR